MEWETAEKVQKNDAGQFRALIGGEWLPVEKAQKNESGQFRILRATEQKKPEPTPEKEQSTLDTIKGSAKEVSVDLPRAALYWGIHKPAMAGTQLLTHALASGSETVAPDTSVSKYLRGEATRADEFARRAEKNYQSLVPDNPASYAGATVGAIMPFTKAGYLKGPMETAGNVAGKPVEAITKAILRSPTLAKYAGKVGAGAGMGAAATLASPVTEEGSYWDNLMGKAETGAGIGAAIPAIGIPTIAAGKWGFEKGKELATPWFESLRTGAGRKFLSEALGDSKQKVINAIREYYQPSQVGPQPQVKLGPVTTSDIIAGANVGNVDKFGSQLVKAEQSLSRQGTGISDAAKSVHAAQEAARAAEIGKIAQTSEALAAAEKLRATTTTPMRETALQNANIAGVKAPELQSRVASRAQEAAKAVEDVRRLSMASAHAEALANTGSMRLGKPSPPIPGLPRAPGRYAYPMELANLGEAKAAGSADLSLQRGAEARFAQKQLESLAQAGHFPLESGKVVGQITKIQNTPGNVTNTTIQKAMNEIKDLIAKATNKNGVIDARELYTIRKSEAGNVIAKFAEENKTWDKRFTAGLLKDVQNMIDAAIESAGGTGWGAYLKKYGELSGPINRMNVGQELAKGLTASTGKERASTFLNAQREAARTTKSATGMPREDLSEILPAHEMAGVDKVTRALARETEKRNLASGVEVRDMFNIVEGGKGKFEIPHLLSRPFVLSNWVFKVTGNSADDLIARDIGNLLIKDPAGFSKKYLEAVPPTRRDKVVQMLQKIKQQNIIAPAVQYSQQENK